jgi:2-polyprenyl-6-methoxyphenol hydroxylase-like FAD-dependent oxidoreductase
VTAAHPVVIVGAGPGGAALALLLVSRGIATTLIERQHDFAREFRGEVMMPSGLEVLDALGLDLRRDGVPHTRPEALELRIEGRPVARFDATEGFFADRAPLFVSQPALLEHLVALAARHPGFRLLRGVAVRDLVRENGRVAGVRVAGQSGEERVPASFVVGADGRASIVRRRGGFPARDLGAPMDIVWAKLPWPEAWHERAAHGYVGGGHLLVAVPAPDGLLQLGWVILKGTFGELKSRGVEDWVRELANHVGDELGPHLRANAERLTRPFLLSAATDRVAGWARPGALVIGDAAHTMSPVGGQGINVALRDAVVAANRLVPVLREGGAAAALDAAAASVERERGPEIDRIQQLAAQPPRLVLARGAFPRLVRTALPWLIRLPFARHGASGLAEAFLNGVTEVRLTV